MAEKHKSAKNATKAAPVPSKANSKSTKSPAAPKGETRAVLRESYSVILPAVNDPIRLQKQKGTEQGAAYASFDEAKERAIDGMIALIEDCERQLYRLKCANSFADFQNVCVNNSSGSSGENG